MQNPALPVRPFAGQRPGAPLTVKTDAQFHQFHYPQRALGDQDLHRPGIAQSSPRFQGILQVQRWGISLIDSSSNAALRHLGVAVLGALLGDHQHRTQLPGFIGSKKTGNPAPDN